MIGTEPLFSWDDDFRYVKYYSSKDSSIKIEVCVRYAQLNQLQAYQDQEAAPLLSRIDAINERIISNEFKVIRGKKVILVTCDYEQPKRKLNKGQAMRIVFNTSAGLTSVIVSHNYKNESDKENGKKLFSTIVDKLEMH
ncbi:hypothetical protein [Chitinophaga sp. CF418]|uniref:hypothetical protein n=1 Tax=Chitinophaga sp. CF418 TaxID=1855287 RepID=UPI000922049E|nr:hypothetical protein [Chitinophaga sp. CF418]SHN45110.1 hypothetical protein SAMN05216311_1195 [Chitinophaga sp. CF418]